MHSFPNFEPVHWSRTGSNYCFLTCMQVSQEAGQVVWCSHLLQNVAQFVVLSQCLYCFAFPAVMNESSCCFTVLSTFGIVVIMDFGHSNRCVVVSHWFWFSFLWRHLMWNILIYILHILIYHPCIFFVEVPIKAFGPYFNRVVCVLTIEF